MSLKIFSGGTQKRRVVKEPAKAVVALVAEQCSDSVGRVAVIDRQRFDLTSPYQRLGFLADRTDAVLSAVERQPIIWREAIIDAQIAAADVSVPFLVCVSRALRGVPSSLHISLLFLCRNLPVVTEILNAAIGRISITKPYPPARVRAVHVCPNDPLYWNPHAANVDIALPSFGMSAGVVPRSNNLPAQNCGMRSSRVAPPQRGWNLTIVLKKVLRHFLRNVHAQIVPPTRMCCNV